jgi:hypothetical protein
LRQNAWVIEIATTSDGVSLTLTPGVDPRQSAAYLNWQLVSAGVSVFDLRISRASLEERFLEITTTFGSQS